MLNPNRGADRHMEGQCSCPQWRKRLAKGCQPAVPARSRGLSATTIRLGAVALAALVAVGRLLGSNAAT